MTRISITSRVEESSAASGHVLDETSDPAASASSGASDNPASSAASGHDESGTTRGDAAGGGRAAAAASSPDVQPAQSTESAGSAASPQQSMEERLRDLRMILPGVPDSELREMLRQNDRASENTARSERDASAAAAAAETQSTTRPSPGTPGSLPSRGLSSGSGRSSRGSRRSWQPCRPAPSRPGVFSVGGPIEQGGTFNIGETDPDLMDVKRIDAANSVQEALRERLGYDLLDSGKYEECKRLYKEGERVLASTGFDRREKPIMPKPMMWETPPLSAASMRKREPKLDEIGEPLPLPLSFGGREEGGNGEIALGKLVDVAPDETEDEQKREEVLDSDSWQDVSVDTSPPGPYDHVVRCMKCRAGLRVHIEVGLVACPRCRGISPATDVVKITR